MMKRFLYTIVFLFSFSTLIFAQDEEKMITAAATGNLSKVTSYVKKGVDVNAKSKTRWTALAYAAKYNYKDIVEYLLENGADINQKVNTGATALQISVNEENYDIAKLLISKKANIEVKDIIGLTALALAAKSGDLKAVKFLVENGANVNTKNNNGRTILDMTTDSSVKEFLRSKGAKTNEELFNAATGD
ncbi:MAG TPA: hypothetical protein DDX39_07205 [Bacteroidales bacterium]|nr:MAG: hypothetical protein A2W98_01965 [Bacteroidetes bacterium GWF2_33_38]OFY75109.1 MAG: hypothetical protein A2265_11390 [Bacteroidetes bacterium RIFOXYA12_FULL_33_9]OFY85235.1 MAG: hypothetical protein A2236_10350 [Bacteroidetes bacterium RIFOXYA2_FULL_33_7]HBF88417.1 hypothetical protein [Bacteroidales bacterium]